MVVGWGKGRIPTEINTTLHRQRQGKQKSDQNRKDKGNIKAKSVQQKSKNKTRHEFL